MATNFYFSQKVRSEQKLYEDIVIEALKTYGQDVYYLPRDIVNEDKILGDDPVSSFNSSYKVEMYIENTEGFDGEGDLFTRFGVEIRDEATFIVSRRRWEQTIQRYDNEITVSRPAEGDVIYLPLSKSFFQISHVEHEQPFYQLSNLPVYKLRCQLFEYTGEQMDTGVDVLDNLEGAYAYKYILSLNNLSAASFKVGETITSPSGDTTMRGEVVKFSDSDNKLHVIHAGADDGKYHTFVDSATVTGLTTNATGVITLVVEDNQLSQNEQNTDFSTGADFIDFSESNPFGDVSNN
jgi:hypothetical protein